MSAAAQTRVVARVHRIGQSRPVTVHRLAAKGTVDQRLLRMMDAGELPTEFAIDEHGGDRRRALGLVSKAILGHVHPAFLDDAD